MPRTLLTLAVLTISALALAACRTGTARGDLSEKVINFDQFPLVWLGPSYDADGDGNPDPVTTARVEVSPAFYHPTTGQLIKPEFHWFSIVYGDCKIPAGATACPVPLQLDLYAPCATSRIPDVPKRGTQKLHGLDAIIEISGNVRLDTADFTVVVSPIGATDAEKTQKALRIAEDLVPANASARQIITGRDFRSRPKDLCKTSQDGNTPVPGSSPTSSCCSLQLDMDPATPGVQASRSVNGPQNINIDIVLGDSVGSLGALDVSLVYDDTRLTPAGMGSGGLDGNPDFNDGALGTAWNCGLGGSPSPDIDEATGPDHGAALLSCFTTAGGATVGSATAVATLRLHVAASGTSNITIGSAHLSHYDSTDIGTCDAGGGTMTCAGGSLTAP